MERRLDEIEESLVREIRALLGGALFSGYSDRAHARADDLAVRTRVSQEILDGKSHVSSLIARWWSNSAPAPSRDTPFPPAELTATLRSLRDFEARLGDLEATIRNAPAPDFAAAWSPSSREGKLMLQTILQHDRAMIARAQELSRVLLALREADLSEPAPFTAATQPLADLESILRERRTFVRHG